MPLDAQAMKTMHDELLEHETKARYHTAQAKALRNAIDVLEGKPVKVRTRKAAEVMPA